MTEENKISMWPDEKILQSLAAVSNEDGEITGAEIMLVMKNIRDELENRIAELERSVPVITHLQEQSEREAENDDTMG